MSSIIQIRVEDDLKIKSDTLFRELGTDTKKTVNPYVTLTEDEILKKLETSRQHAAEGMVRDADDVISDMRQKYGI